MSLLVQFIISTQLLLLPGRLHIARTSRGSGKPLMLLVHGFPEAWFAWAKQMAEFRDQYEVVAVDMRGYGESSKPKGWLSYHQYHLADDLLAVTEHLLQESGQKQVVLAGHDWGGHMCWCLAYMAPHLFSHLITLCVPHPGLYHKNRDLSQRIRHSYVLAFQLPWLGEAALCVNDYALLESVLYIERYKQAFGRPGVQTAALNYYRAVNNALFPTEKLHRLLAGKLLVPTLMLWGGRDINLSQVLLRDTDKHVDRLRVEVLPDSSHWMLHDCPAEVKRLMRDFLQA
ncbi:AB hydrolase superfamily protein YfhM [Chlorella vulgaris]